METQEKKIAVTGKEGAEIDLSIAAEWTKNHRERHPKETISQLFGKEMVQKILDQKDCAGLRIYYSNSENLTGWQKFIVSISNFLLKTLGGCIGEKHVILAGVTMNGEDQLPPFGGQKMAVSNTGGTFEYKAQALSDPAPVLVEQAHPCPGSYGCPDNVMSGQ